MAFHNPRRPSSPRKRQPPTIKFRFKVHRRFPFGILLMGSFWTWIFYQEKFRRSLTVVKVLEAIIVWPRLYSSLYSKFYQEHRFVFQLWTPSSTQARFVLWCMRNRMPVWWDLIPNNTILARKTTRVKFRSISAVRPAVLWRPGLQASSHNSKIWTASRRGFAALANFNGHQRDIC